MTRIVRLETAGLGDRSYLVTDGEVAVVVDPQRDIDRVLALIDQHGGVRITHVLETHLHNDYVTGGLELAWWAGAEYLVPAGEPVSFERLPFADGDSLTSGEIRMRAVHTPGHTFHHLSYVLDDADGRPRAVFTGGSMLYGTTGRTDLLGPEHTDALTRRQFWSVRRLAAELSPETEVYPTHGLGSFCSAAPATYDESTIGQERDANPALTMEAKEYADNMLSGLIAYPAYYARIGTINRRGPEPVDLALPTEVGSVELRRRIEGGEWVVDLRDRKAFAAAHLEGSLGFELNGGFVTHLGWLYRWDVPLTLIGDSLHQVAEAVRELARIGVDSPAGMATADDITTLADGGTIDSYPVSDFACLAKARAEREVLVLDVRRDDERAHGGIAGSLHIPIHQLPDRVGEIPAGQIWVHCTSGYRSSVVASFLDAIGRQVVLIDDEYGAAKEAGLERQK